MKSEGDFEARIKCVTFPRHRFVLVPGTGRVLKTPSPEELGVRECVCSRQRALVTLVT